MFEKSVQFFFYVFQVMIDMKLAELHDDSNLKSKGLIHFSQNATFYFCLIIVLILTIICTSSLFLLDDNGSIPTHHFRGRCNIPVRKISSTLWWLWRFKYPFLRSIEEGLMRFFLYDLYALTNFCCYI